MNGSETLANRAARFRPLRTATAARSRSVLMAVQGAASVRYWLPSTQSWRSAWADLRNSRSSMKPVSSRSLASDVGL